MSALDHSDMVRVNLTMRGHQHWLDTVRKEYVKQHEIERGTKLAQRESYAHSSKHYEERQIRGTHYVWLTPDEFRTVFGDETGTTVTYTEFSGRYDFGVVPSIEHSVHHPWFVGHVFHPGEMLMPA